MHHPHQTIRVSERQHAFPKTITVLVGYHRKTVCILLFWSLKNKENQMWINEIFTRYPKMQRNQLYYCEIIRDKKLWLLWHLSFCHWHPFWKWCLQSRCEFSKVPIILKTVTVDPVFSFPILLGMTSSSFQPHWFFLVSKDTGSFLTYRVSICHRATLSSPFLNSSPVRISPSRLPPMHQLSEDLQPSPGGLIPRPVFPEPGTTRYPIRQ